MGKKNLFVIHAFFLSLSAIGQPSYYLAEQTSIKQDIGYSDFGKNIKFKSESKYGADGYIRFSASYIWNNSFREKPNSEGYYEQIGWAGRDKYEYIYAHESDFGLQVFYGWNYNTEDWEVVKKIERKRDSDNKKIFSITWENENEKWIPRYKTEHEYVKNKKIYTEYSWDREIESLAPYYKHEDEYNTKGERVLCTAYYWDKLQNGWIFRSKAEFKYNKKGQEIRQVNYLPKNSAWIRNSKTEIMKYDNEGIKELFVHYKWDENKRKWIETGTIDNKKWKGKIDPNEQKHWNDSLNVWIDNIKMESQIDELGREILSISYEWNSTKKKWQQASKKEIEYDENNNPIFIHTYIWQQEKWEFSESRESRYEKRE